jgi:hypothetical protein
MNIDAVALKFPSARATNLYLYIFKRGWRLSSPFLPR